MSLKSSLEFYKQAKYLYKDISQTYQDLEARIIPEEKLSLTINRTLNDINRLVNLLNRIDVRDFSGNYTNSVIEITEHNIDFYYEAAYYLEKILIADKYRESLYNSIDNYIKDINQLFDLSVYAKHEKGVGKKFVQTILHPDNITQYMSQIKRIAVGTMHRNEFKKIFNTLKSKIPRLPKSRFESFKEYKQ